MCSVVVAISIRQSLSMMSTELMGAMVSYERMGVPSKENSW